MAMARSIRVCFFNSQSSGPQKNGVCSNLKVKLSTSAKRLPFVPRCEEATDQDISHLAEFISRAKRLFVLTGAGVSTESGIPDYRSEGVGQYARSKNRPVQFADFMKNAHSRQRYWARNYVGWPWFSSFDPNETHRIFSQWERAGKIHWLVTQNVDALHCKAGSSQVTELHGSAHRVVCLNCHHLVPRHTVQEQIRAHNPHWHAESSQIAPDGDISLTPEQIQGFRVPECQQCGGVLKPEIVFFGDNVPRPTVNFVFDKLAESDAMLVVGSSLEVYSGYRIANRAREARIPLAIVNIGQTRADKLASLKISARCGHVLQRVHEVFNTSKY